MSNENCLFCKIVTEEIPCDKIYEDKDFLAFLDIKPVADGHLLIIPKNHFMWMQDVDDETIKNIFVLTKKIMLGLKKGLNCDYVQTSVVGTEVPHFHIHLIPRYNNHEFPNLPTKEYKNGEEKEVLKKIIQGL